MYDNIKEIIDQSNHIVVMSGLNLMRESGLYGVRQEERAYEIEEKYGFSPEEIATTEFLMRRVELFYQFYKEEILNLDKTIPTKAYYAIARLEKRKKLLCVVTQSIYGMHQMAGLHNIVELHGNVNENKCPKCGKLYNSEYIIHSEGIPVCEKCQVVLKPGFALFGETIDNGRISKVADYLMKADTILLAGASTNSALAKYMLQYYKGNQLIVVNSKESSGDDRANYVIYGKCMDILPQLIPEEDEFLDRDELQEDAERR